MGSHEKESESGLLESLTLPDFHTVSEYLAARFVLRTRLAIYGGLCLLVGTIFILFIPAMSYTDKSVKLSVMELSVFVATAGLVIAIGVVIVWFPSPRMMLIVSLLAGTLGLIGIVLFFILSVETNIDTTALGLGIFGSLAALGGAGELYRTYLAIRGAFEKMPSAETMEKLSSIKNELIQAASESSREKCFIRFETLTPSSAKWIGKLYSNAACFLVLNDIRGRAMLVEARKCVGMNERGRWKNGTFVDSGLVIGKLNIPTRMPVRDFETLQAWVEAQNTQNHNDVK